MVLHEQIIEKSRKEVYRKSVSCIQGQIRCKKGEASNKLPASLHLDRKFHVIIALIYLE